MAAITKSAGWSSKRDKRKASLTAGGTLAAAAAMLLPCAHAADWQFKPGIALRETYSDNIRLAPKGAERDDFVTEITPQFTLRKNGAGLQVQADYALQNLIYADDSDASATYHKLNARATAELLEGLFFLDGNASIAQQNTSAFGPRTEDNINATGNRSEVRTLSASPYLRKRFGETATAEARYTRDWMSSDAQALTIDHQDRITFAVNSGPEFRTLSWGGNYSRRNVSYDDGRTVRLESATTNFGYRLTPMFSLVATVGYETNNYVTFGEKPEGLIWLAGFKWTPSERTSLEARMGKRFYGNTYSVNASHRARTGVFSLGYNEDLTTALSPSVGQTNINTADLLNDLWRTSIPDNQTRQQMVDTFIRNNRLPSVLTQNVLSLSNRVFIQKALQSSFAFRGPRHTTILTLFNTERTAQNSAGLDAGLPGAAVLGLEGDTRQTGGNVIWNFQLSARTSAGASIGYSRTRSLSSERTDVYRNASVSLSRQISVKTRGTLEFRRQDQDTVLAGGSRVENAINAYLVTNF